MTAEAQLSEESPAPARRARRRDRRLTSCNPTTSEIAVEIPVYTCTAQYARLLGFDTARARATAWRMAITPRVLGAGIDLSVVIVNWNGGEHLDDCLAAVRRSSGTLATEIIVVDNASSDGSFARAEASGAVDRSIANRANLGFTVANNQGARLARGRFVLFLNPDTVPGAGALQTLVELLEANPKIGVLAPRLLDEEGRPSRDMGHRFPTPLTVAGSFLLLSRLAPRIFPGITRVKDVRGLERCDWVCGAALLARREVWERVGWNEDLFLHGEDIDFCAGVRDAGWQIAVTGDAEVKHLGGRSIAQQQDRTLLFESPSGIALHLRRHSGPLGTRVALATMRVGMRARCLAHTALYRWKGDPDHLRKAHKLKLFLGQDRPHDGSTERSASPRPAAPVPARRP